MTYFGIDVHQRQSEICGISDEGEVVVRQRVMTTLNGLRQALGAVERSSVVLECGPSSAWVARVVGQMGHDVSVVNARRVRLIAESSLKTDGVDAEVLARLSRLDLQLLRPVHQRSAEARALRSRLRVRASLLRSRTALINGVRGTLRCEGYRMRSCAPARFVAVFSALSLPEALRQILEPMIATIAHLNQTLEPLEEDLKREAKADERCRRLQSVPGVGPLVSLAFVGWMDDPERFARSRDVAGCLGLRPSLHRSGDRERRGRITREGDREMRRLLVQAAHAALRTRRDSALKRWAESLTERLGRRKAVVALARKIAVLMHHLWVTEQSFEAFPQTA